MSAVGITREAQVPGEPLAGEPHLFAQPPGVADDLAGPVQRALALRGEPAIARAAAHELHAELLFELLDAGRQRRLGQAEARGGAAEVLLSGERDEHFELGQHD